MWGCCADSSSDDDERNTSITLLLPFADAFVAPAFLSDLTELDELVVAQSCRFALDNFTVAQQDWPEHHLLVPSPTRLLAPAPSLGPGRALGPQLGWTRILVAVLLLPAGLLKVPLRPERSRLTCCLGGSLVLLRALVDAGPCAPVVRPTARRAPSFVAHAERPLFFQVT